MKRKESRSERERESTPAIVVAWASEDPGDGSAGGEEPMWPAAWASRSPFRAVA
jgi:hypothetical protein